MDEPSMMDLERGRLAQEHERDNDEDYEIAQFIAGADSLDRRNNKMAEERADKVATNAILHGDHGLLNFYNNSEDLVNYLLLECTYPNYPTSKENGFSADSLPFEASNIHQAIQTGLKCHPHFHFNFCMTTSDDAAGEWHGCLTSTNRNSIFLYEDDEAGTRLDVNDILNGEHDLKFIPIFGAWERKIMNMSVSVGRLRASARGCTIKRLLLVPSAFGMIKPDRGATEEDRTSRALSALCVSVFWSESFWRQWKREL
jgi:hypothetical protein